VCTASRELLLLLVVVPRMLLLVLPLLPLVHASTGALGNGYVPWAAGAAASSQAPCM
jgi:hypothetical protein